MNAFKFLALPVTLAALAAAGSVHANELNLPVLQSGAAVVAAGNAAGSSAANGSTGAGASVPTRAEVRAEAAEAVRNHTSTLQAQLEQYRN